MPVDDYKTAIALTEKIKANLPITARPGKQYLKLMKKQGTPIANDHKMVISSTLYMGDEGGICCGIEPGEAAQQAYVVSITHLEIDPDQPLAVEIQAYQRQRTHKLMMQNSRGFMAEMRRLSETPEGKKKKGDRGFGKSV